MLRVPGAEQVVVGLPPRYRDAVLVARGGMGEVYRAWDDMLERDVAVKVLVDGHVSTWERRLRFQREAAAAARLSGVPHVVAVYDFGDVDGSEYIVMEWCPNGDVLEYARRNHVDVPRVLKCVLQAASALDAAHAAGVVHRDMKPANLLLDADCMVKVADFGLARLGSDETGLTAAGTVLGTAGYMSPEQARGEPATAASDVYALGVVAFELLTGGRPFARVNETAEALAHVQERPPRASQAGPWLPRSVDPVFERVLAKRPEERYPDARRFVDALTRALAAREAARTTLIQPPPAAPRRRRLPGAAVLGLLALLAAAAVAVAAVVDTRAGETQLVQPSPFQGFELSLRPITS